MFLENRGSVLCELGCSIKLGPRPSEAWLSSAWLFSRLAAKCISLSCGPWPLDAFPDPGNRINTSVWAPGSDSLSATAVRQTLWTHTKPDLEEKSFFALSIFKSVCMFKSFCCATFSQKGIFDHFWFYCKVPFFLTFFSPNTFVIWWYV